MLVVATATATAEGAASLTVHQVRFNSDTTDVNAGQFPDPYGGNDPYGGSGPLLPLDDLETSGGPIKVVVRDGSLTINDGLDGDGVGVSVASNDDVLLWATGELMVNAAITSQGGSVTLQSGANLDLNSSVSTIGGGSIYLQSTGRSDLDGAVSAVDGSILVEAGEDISVLAPISTTNGSVGLLSGGNVVLQAHVSAGAHALVTASGDFTQSGGDVTAGNVAQVNAGGTIYLGQITANHVTLEAGVDILDHNGLDTLNVAAHSLRMVAGGTIGQANLAADFDVNANAIDLEVGTVAAFSGTGIYLQELSSGGDLIVDHVAGAATATQRPRRRYRRIELLIAILTCQNGSLPIANCIPIAVWHTLCKRSKFHAGSKFHTITNL